MSSIVLDPAFAQSIKVYRKTGDWAPNGEFVTTENEIIMTGVISIANAKQIEFMPEGDRIGGEIAIHTTQILYNSRSADETETPQKEAGLSDEIEWHGDRYKIYQVNEYSDYGYYFAIGQRKAGD
ncbi:hypothetical protein [Clostridium saccharoperbutylacetonicum]|uniref:hypothetical protein n=1 Tax=Clostridium saccharoperbutylacetonicum TaxID=36745 RepID=UPI0039E9125F